MAKNILIVSRSLPEENAHGSASLMLDFIKFLKCEGHTVNFLYLDLYNSSIPSYIKNAATVLTYIDFYPRPLFDFFKRKDFLTAARSLKIETWDSLPTKSELTLCEMAIKRTNPDIVVADRCWMSPVLDLIPNNILIKKVIFLHDLRIRHVSCMEESGLDGNAAWSEEKENALLKKGETIVVLNEEDQHLCQTMAPHADVIRIGMSAKPKYSSPSQQVAGRLLYVGSGVPENKFAIESFFLKQTWPLIKAEIPGATLMICGSIDTLLSDTPEDVFVTGRVDDLTSHYAQAQVVIVPHVMSGGMKIKFVDALSHGRAVVANANGITGFPEANGTCALIGDDPISFAKMVVLVLSDADRRKKMEQAARQLCDTRLSPSASYAKLLPLLS